MTEEREREVQHEPQVLAGEDELPRQPSAERDAYVPEPRSRPGVGREWQAMRLAWIPLAIVVLIVLIAIFR